MVPLDKGLQWVNVKQKPFRQIQAHSGIIRSPGIIQAYSGILEPFPSLAYLKLWYIQNPNIFRTRSVFRTPAYSQPGGIFRTLPYIYDEAFIIFRAIIIFTNFRKACRVEINILRQFLQRQLCFVKNYVAARGGGDREFLIYLLIYSNKLAFLQLITVLVYRNSPPKS